jgi:hypothetical protein
MTAVPSANQSQPAWVTLLKRIPTTIFNAEYETTKPYEHTSSVFTLLTSNAIIRKHFSRYMSRTGHEMRKVYEPTTVGDIFTVIAINLVRGIPSYQDYWS